MACLVQSNSVVDSTSGGGSWSPLYGGGGGKASKLDSDAIQIIHCIYCKDCRMEKLAAEQQAREAQQQGGAMAPGDLTGTGVNQGVPGEAVPPTSPQISLDQGSIQHTMDKNKETLKRKLMLRRSVNELVERGIYPPLKTPPAFAGQQKQLERAKTGDLLRHKIQQRPERSELVKQHILEADTGTLDPSLVERQRLLKRARLVDGLNDKLSHRPGPLELVQGNILVSSDELSEAIKDGKLQFNRTCEGEDPNNRMRHFTFDEESVSSDDVPSPSMDESSLSDISSPNSLPSAPELSFSVQKSPISFPSAFSGKNVQLVSPPPQLFSNLTSGLSSPEILGPSTSGLSSISSRLSPSSSTLSSSNSSSGGGVGKVRPKKPKQKPTSKTKVIKFHEYKGPPNVVKSQPLAGKDSETPYHIMLQQQQLFLQWQLEFKQKNMPFVVSSTAPQKLAPDSQPMFVAAASQGGSSSPSSTATTMMVTAPVMSTTQPISSHTIVAPPQPLQPSPSVTPSPVTLPPPPPPPPPPPLPPTTQAQTTSQTVATPPAARPIPNQGTKANPVSVAALSMPKITVNLEDLKVADLKAELKKRNLPVSGSKPQLIERLRPYTEVSAGGTPNNIVAKSSLGSKNPSPSPPMPASTPTPPPAVQIKKEPGSSDPAGQACSMASPPVVPSMASALSMKLLKEEPMHTGGSSPSPGSPATMEAHTTPMSPDIFSITSPPPPVNLTFSSSVLSSPQPPSTPSSTIGSSTAQPMPMDQSRPPSAMEPESGGAPMDVEPMDLGSSLSDFKAITVPISQLPPNIAKPQITPAQQQQINTQTALLQLEQLQQLQSQLQAQQAQVQVQVQHAQKQAQVRQQVQLPTQLSGQPQVLQIRAQPQSQSLISQPAVQVPAASLAGVVPSTLQPQLTTATLRNLGINLGTPSTTTVNVPPDSDEVVKAQARKIEELQRQLQESNIRLQLQLLQQQQQQLLLQQQQQLQGPPLLQVQLPQTTSQTSPQSLLGQQKIVSPSGQPLISQPQLSPQPALDLNAALQQQQQQQQQKQQQQQASPQPQQISPVTSIQPTASVLNTVHINLANPGLTTTGTAEDSSKLQTATSTTRTTQSVLNPVCLAPNLTTATTKKIQIPANFLHQHVQQQPQQQQQQQQQNLLNSNPTMVTTSVGEITLNKVNNKTNLNDFLKSQVLGQGLIKPIVNPAPTVATASNTSVPYVFTATPPKMTTSLNGLNTVSRTVSLPGSLPDSQKQQVSRSSSNPFFGIPLKEPPKYDEAVRSKQHQPSPASLSDAVSVPNVSTGSASPASASQQEQTKCQAMDDVLEILIRNGDLPPSAADEPLPTPRATEAGPVPGMSMDIGVSQPSNIAMSLGMPISSSPALFSLPGTSLPSASSHTTYETISPLPAMTMPGSPAEMLGGESLLSNAAAAMGSSNKTSMAECSPPMVNVLPPATTDQRNVNLSNELLDLQEMLSGDLNAMEWSSDAGFVGLDLGEASMHIGSSTTNSMGGGDSGMGSSLENTLGVPSTSQENCARDSVNGSEPDLTSLGLHDGEGDDMGGMGMGGMQIDVSDWLDVIMPSTGLTPLSTNAPVSFSADPVLTPKTQQEVLDLFNFEDGDFPTPSDTSATLSWDKLTEPGTSSS